MVETTWMTRTGLGCLADTSDGHEDALKPHIRDASTIVRQAFPAFKSVEMVHVDGGHGLWFRKPEVDGDSAAAISIGREPAPISYATAVRTEMKTELRLPQV
jgi:hypothetical protein